VAPARLVLPFAASAATFSTPLVVLVTLVWVDRWEPRKILGSVHLILKLFSPLGCALFLVHDRFDPCSLASPFRLLHLKNSENERHDLNRLHSTNHDLFCGPDGAPRSADVPVCIVDSIYQRVGKGLVEHAGDLRFAIGRKAQKTDADAVDAATLAVGLADNLRFG
jgi:hypothetical protein